MDLIRISDTKLKIMLTNDDMQKYQIHNDADIIPDGRMRDTLKRLLCDARVQDGFIGDDSRVYIQMFPCAKGSFTALTVTGGLHNKQKAPENRCINYKLKLY